MTDIQFVPAGSSLEVSAFDLDSYSTGTNDQGQALYEFDGIEMTAEQAEEHADYFMADPEDTYHHSDSQGGADEALPDSILDGLYAVNDALGGEGAAEFYADELLGLGESRMDEVLANTGMSRDEIQANAAAVMIDMADTVGIPHDYLMNELQADIERVRASGSHAAVRVMREVIADSIAGKYHEAMTAWDNLRAAMKHAQR